MPARPQPLAEVTVKERGQFERDIVARGEPVGLRGLVAQWPAVERGRESPEAI